MKQQVKAIINCRVSSAEQLKSNSLSRQEQIVYKAAASLGAKIPENGKWSGSVSSKAGTNVNRKDLIEMLEYCTRHKDVKYAIFDEVDRFMRSTKEMFYWITRFQFEAGVQIYFASNPELNTNDAKGNLLLSLDGYKAEGSNEERQQKSIKGHIAAISQGRYTFHPKAGYMKGTEPGIHLLHPSEGPALRKVMKDIASGKTTVSEGLKDLNRSDFTNTHAPLKMDKFKVYIADPYYKGEVWMSKQVKAHNKNGLHEPLITSTEHKMILQAIENMGKRKYIRQKSNPLYPLSRIGFCGECNSEKGKLVGFDHTNGHGNSYGRYRCRKCATYFKSDDIHEMLNKLFKNLKLEPGEKIKLVSELKKVWRQNEKEMSYKASSIKTKITNAEKQLGNQISALTDPANSSIRDEIRTSIENKKEEITNLKTELDKNCNYEENMEKFIEFALSFTEELRSRWWKLDREDQITCKELLFPGELYVRKNQKVYTNEISPIYRLTKTENNFLEPKRSQMVELAGISPASVW